MNNDDKLSYDEMDKKFREAVEQKHNPSYGLDATYTNDVLGGPTKEEKEDYNKARADVNNDYMAAREQGWRNDVNRVLDSVSDYREEVQKNYNPEYTPERAESLLSSVRDKEKTSTEEESIKKVTDIPVYEVLRSQPTKGSNKEIEPVQKDKLKKTAEKIAIAILTGAIAYGAVKGGISVIKNPDPITPEQTPQTIELQENINNAENFNEVIDAINENKERNIESGIKTNSEHVIESSSNEEKVAESNRQKVASITSLQPNQQQTEGGRSY